MQQTFFNNKNQSHAAAMQLAKELMGKVKTVYDLSMLLLANPSLYDAAQFEELLVKAKSKESIQDPATSWMSSDEFARWMKGRQLFCVMKSDPKDANSIAEKLHASLRLDKPKSEQLGKHPFDCWALGYLLAYYGLHDKPAYEASKSALQEAVKYQLEQYKRLIGQEKEKFYPDVMWSYAMAIQAAAWKVDESTYKQYMEQFAALTDPQGTAASSIRALPNDQFPAWLASIIYGSVVKMKDPQVEVVAIEKELSSARIRTASEQDKMLSYATQHEYRQLALATTQQPQPTAPIKSKL